MEKDQHRSWVRSHHVSVREDHGEIFDDRLNVMADAVTPLHLKLQRINRGEQENQESYDLPRSFWSWTNRLQAREE